jgi:hypothetical protein
MKFTRTRSGKRPRRRDTYTRALYHCNDTFTRTRPNYLLTEPRFARVPHSHPRACGFTLRKRPRTMNGMPGMSRFGLGAGGPSAAAGDAPQVDTAEQVYISSLALLKMLKHGTCIIANAAGARMMWHASHPVLIARRRLAMCDDGRRVRGD